MGLTVCISGWSGASAPHSQGGIVWYYLDWALGFQDAGATILWLEADRSLREGADRATNASRVRSRLAEFGLDCRVVLWNQNDDPQRRSEGQDEVSLSEAHEVADLYLDLAYFAENETIVRPFRRSAFVDGDPGVVQSSLERGDLKLPPYTSYFTLSDTLPKGLSRFSSCGIDWNHARPPVHIPSWPVQPPPGEAPYTTITNWWASDKDWFHHEGQWQENSKRAAWKPFLDAPKQAGVNFEVAVTLTSAEVDEAERAKLEKHGWGVRTLHEVPFGPREYQRYLQESRGEFACAKPAYALLQAGMIYPRSLQYLASGRPVVIQDTGPVSYMDESPCRALLRFRSPDEAVRHLRSVERHHEQISLEARTLVEDLFSSGKVAEHILNVSLG